MTSETPFTTVGLKCSGGASHRCLRPVTSAGVEHSYDYKTKQPSTVYVRLCNLHAAARQRRRYGDNRVTPLTAEIVAAWRVADQEQAERLRQQNVEKQRLWERSRIAAAARLREEARVEYRMERGTVGERDDYEAIWYVLSEQQRERAQPAYYNSGSVAVSRRPDQPFLIDTTSSSRMHLSQAREFARALEAAVAYAEAAGAAQQ